MKAHFGLAALSAGLLCSAAESTCQEAEAPLAHVRNSFNLMVHAPYRDAAPLFGPNGERGWGEGHWDPHFFYPQPGRDVEGAVFAISTAP